jgi:hypothetical protein
MSKLFVLALLVITYLPAHSDEADVLDVDVSCNSESVCRFDVTVMHDDEGCVHYANRWEVLSPDRKILATRVLAHPHDSEQPFTRSLAGVRIPSDLLEVVVRAHDLKHEYGGKEFVVKLPR